MHKGVALPWVACTEENFKRDATIGARGGTLSNGAVFGTDFEVGPEATRMILEAGRARWMRTR